MDVQKIAETLSVLASSMKSEADMSKDEWYYILCARPRINALMKAINAVLDIPVFTKEEDK